MNQENIALAAIGATVPSNHPDEQAQFENGQLHEFSLPRADGGKDAWLFLAGCFTLEALIWGKVLQAHALRHTIYASSTDVYIS